MNPKNLPLGINTLDKLRGSNCIYVDKTRLAFQLIKQPGAFFLSRPRRFWQKSVCRYPQGDFRGESEIV